MKKFLAGVALVVALFTTSYAVAADPYMYLGYGLGFQSDQNVGGVMFDSDLSHDIEAGIGQSYGDWRTELSFGYQNMGGSGSVYRYDLEGNVDVYKVRLGVDRALPQFTIREKYVPYFGFGVGPNFYDADLTVTGRRTNMNVKDGNGTDMVLGYDLTVGVTRDVPEWGAFGVAYRYDNTFDNPVAFGQPYDPETHILEFKWYWQ